MKWAKAKTIFIIIFLFVNMFLFAIYRMNSEEGKTVDPESIGIILKNHGITADTKSFEKLKKDMPQFEVKQLQSDKEFIKSFFTTEVKSEDGAYISATETATFTENGISYKNTSPSLKGFSGINKHNAPSKVIKHLEKKGLDKKTLSPERVTENTDGSFTVSLSYYFLSEKILNNSLYITANNNGITEIKGPLLIFEEVKNGFYQTASWETALIDFVAAHGAEHFKGNHKLSSLKCGYFVSTDSASLSTYALPAYKLSFDDGRCFYIDGRANIEPEFILLGK